MPFNPSDLRRFSELLGQAGGGSGPPLVWMPTHEEDEALALVRAACVNAGRALMTWTCVQGVCEGMVQGSVPESGTEAPIVGLARLSMIAQQHAREHGTNSADGRSAGPVLVLFDVIDHLAEPRTLRVFRDVVSRAERDGALVVLIDHKSEAPAVIQRIAQRFELGLPEEAELEQLVRAALKSEHEQQPITVNIRRSEFQACVRNLRGLTRRQARQVVQMVVRDDRTFDANDLPRILSAKRKALTSAGSGVLEHVEAPASLDQIGGMSRLKAWLKTRANSVSDEAAAFGLSPPRGVLLLGVQGAGKSLCAKAIATAWQRPLMRMNVGAVYDRYIGESEKQLREAFSQAQAMAPMVLWIDEIEKSFASAASQSSDGGLSKRLFGELLTWLQEHRSAVFTVATANDIDALPPELLRKGRFDEIFFVDLPGDDARREILKIHVTKRKRDVTKLDLDRLVKASRGYSGSEIEQAIIAALQECYASRSGEGGAERALDTALLEACLRNSPPLSVTMAEKIEALRAWAAGRCVPAE